MWLRIFHGVALALWVSAASSGEQIPLVVGSDYQAPPVRANFPEDRQPEIRILSFEPQKAAGETGGAKTKPRSRAMEICIDDASKRPTDTGVRVALSECQKKYGEQ